MSKKFRAKSKSAISIPQSQRTNLPSAKRLEDDFKHDFTSFCNDFRIDPVPLLMPITECQPYSTSEPQTIFVVFEKTKHSTEPQKFFCNNLRIPFLEFDDRLENCQIDAAGVIIIAEILKDYGTVQYLNLDMNPNPEKNFYILCSPSANLMYLSLNNCEISDEGVLKITNELTYKDPPNEPKLIAINLANNNISSVGGHHIAKMLHTNRSLRSLILSGNSLEDDAVDAIMSELCMYNLKHDEIVELRRRKLARLQNKEKPNIEIKVIKPPQSQKTPREEKKELIARDDITNNKKKSSTNLRASKRGSTHTLTRRSSRQNSSKKSEHMLMDVPEVSEFQKSQENTNEIDRHPLVVEGVPLNGSITLKGNFVLQQLNLNCNS